MPSTAKIVSLKLRRMANDPSSPSSQSFRKSRFDLLLLSFSPSLLLSFSPSLLLSFSPSLLLFFSSSLLLSFFHSFTFSHSAFTLLRPTGQKADDDDFFLHGQPTETSSLLFINHGRRGSRIPHSHDWSQRSCRLHGLRGL